MNKVFLSIENQIATLTIHNPPVNALDKIVITELLEHLDNLANEDNVRVVMVTGSGEKAFVAGADIKEFPQFIKKKEAGEVTKFIYRSHYMFNTIANFPKPTIAVLNGVALGGGCELALACDFRIMSNKAKIGLPEIKLGIYPGGGGTQRLSRLIGTSKAKEMMYIGDSITAEEAQQIGLVNLVTNDDELKDKAAEFANRFSGNSGFALNLIKQLVDRGTEMSLEAGLRLEADLFERVFTSKDAEEGITAFIEKRKPQFRHR